MRRICHSALFLAILVLVAITVEHARSMILSGPISSGHYIAPSPTPTPPACGQVIPGTRITVGASCMPAADFPAQSSLTTPHDPCSFGTGGVCTTGQTTGQTDVTSLIQTAINAGDVVFTTPGTYLVNGAYTNLPNGGSNIAIPANRVIEAAPGVNVTLYAPTLNTCNASTTCSGGNGSCHNCAIFELLNSGDKILNLTFKGGNVFGAGGSNCTGPGGPCNYGANNGQFLVWPLASNFVLEGDTFQDAWAVSAVNVYGGSSTPPSGWTAKYNSFIHNPYFGLNIEGSASTNGQLSGGPVVQFNYQQDGVFGSEFDGCPNPTTQQQYITYQYNEVVSSVGDCFNLGGNCDPTSGLVASDASNSCQVTTNLFKCNYSQGNATMAGRIRLQDNGGLSSGPAQAQNNMFGPTINSTCDTTGCDSGQTLTQNQATCTQGF